jgi:hypothetical protein
VSTGHAFLNLGRKKHRPGFSYTDRWSEDGNDFRNERHYSLVACLDPPTDVVFVANMEPATDQVEILHE